MDSPLAALSSQVRALRCTLAIRIAQHPIALCRFRLYVRSRIAVLLVTRARLSYDVRMSHVHTTPIVFVRPRHLASRRVDAVTAFQNPPNLHNLEDRLHGKIKTSPFENAIVLSFVPSMESFSIYIYII